MRGTLHPAARTLTSFCRVCLLLLAGGISALSQSSTSGALRGTVVDPLGAVLPGSRISLKSLASGQEISIDASRDGTFLVLALSPGDWSVIVRSPGFSPLALSSVRIALGSMTDLRRIALPVGAAQSITVSAEPDDAASASATTVFNGSEIGDLPLDGRRWQSFARLVPEASPVDTSIDLISFRAISSTQNATMLDGLSDDQSYSATPRGVGQDTGPEVEDETENPNSTPHTPAPGFNSGSGAGRHPGMDYTLPLDAVREFRVTASNDSALFGHAAGGSITTVTRRGNDRLHGSLFLIARSSRFRGGRSVGNRDVLSRWRDQLVGRQTA